MSGSLSKEERRNIRRTLGETAAGAMAEAKQEVQQFRGELLQALDVVRAIDARTKLHQQRLDGMAKLGFDNERTCQERWDSTSDTTKRAWDVLMELQMWRARGFLARLKWLVLGR